jgi:hypothetical protein
MNVSSSVEITALPPKWLKVPDACRYGCMSRAKLYQLMSEGQIKSVCVRSKGNIRGMRLISVESIDAFLESFTKREVIA